MISNGEHKSKSITVDLSLGHCNEQKQAIRINMLGQRLEAESGISQKVCHQHGPWVGLAHNQQFTLKAFATALTQIPSHPLLSCLTSSPPLPHHFSCPCPAAECLRGPLRHSIIPLTKPLPYSFSLSSLSLPLSFTHCLFHLKILKTFHRSFEWMLFSDYCKHARKAKQIYI